MRRRRYGPAPPGAAEQDGKIGFARSLPMARAVAQRKNVPYVLIAFVFLFLVASVLGVMAYMQGDDLKQENARLKVERGGWPQRRTSAGRSSRPSSTPKRPAPRKATWIVRSWRSCWRRSPS